MVGIDILAAADAVKTVLKRFIFNWIDMNDFPFDVVYKHFAGPLLIRNLPKEQLDPVIYMVGIVDGAIDFSKPIPQQMTNMFFGTPNGKEALGSFINHIIGDKNAPFDLDGCMNCLVVISEAYMKFMDKPKKDTLKGLLKSSLADDPDASDCIMIAIYRPGITRMGALRVNGDRSVTWSDMLPYNQLAGRLSGKPESEDSFANQRH